MSTWLRGTGEPLELDPRAGVRMVGERINPSGRRRLLAALLARDWEFVAAEARAQVAAGADVVDVNVGGPGVDEEEVLPEAVRVVSGAVTVPLSIDTRNPAALRAALAACPGRPLVNSISGERRVLDDLLPVVAERGVPVIVLCMGQEGIPAVAAERVGVAEAVRGEATGAGIAEADLLLDPVVMTVGADDLAARVTLETVALLRRAFPDATIAGGASNVSYGMPVRPRVNAAFLTVAAYLGMNLPITDPTSAPIREAVLLADVLGGRDRHSRRFVRAVREAEAVAASGLPGA